MSQAPRWLPMRRAPSRRRPLRTHAAARSLSTPTHFPWAPWALLLLLGRHLSFIIIIVIMILSLYKERKSDAGCSVFWQPGTVTLLSAYCVPGLSLGAGAPTACPAFRVEPECCGAPRRGSGRSPRPMFDSLKLGRIGGPFGEEGHQKLRRKGK